MSCMKVPKSRKWEMGNRKIVRIGLLTLVFALIFTTIHAQISGKSIPELRQELNASAWIGQYPNASVFQGAAKFYLPFSNNHLPHNIFFKKHYAGSGYTVKTEMDIPNLHKYEHLPIFCKFEVKMEQAARFPIKMRLGDVEYVDRLEGKRN